MKMQIYSVQMRTVKLALYDLSESQKNKVCKLFKFERLNATSFRMPRGVEISEFIHEDSKRFNINGLDLQDFINLVIPEDLTAGSVG